MQKKKEAKIISLDYTVECKSGGSGEAHLSAKENEAALVVLSDLIEEYIRSLKDLEQLMAKETERG